MAYDLHGLFGWLSRELRSSPDASLEALARRVGVGRHTLSKVVANETGGPFRQLRNSKMAESAITMLSANPGLSLKEVAFTLGYSSQRAFARFIKAHTGMSPKQLRLVLSKRSAEINTSRSSE
jgi:AraC-like DNA-binding protein